MWFRGHGEAEKSQSQRIRKIWVTHIRGKKIHCGLVNFSWTLLASSLEMRSPLSPRGTFPLLVWEFQRTSWRGRLPKGILLCWWGRQLWLGSSNTGGRQAVEDFLWMDDSFNFTPQQRWYPASTTSNQFCKSHFVAENWFTAPTPSWRPNFPGWRWRFCRGGMATEWFFFV